MQACTKDKIQLYSHMKDIPKESLRSHKAEIGGELQFILFQTLRLSDSIAVSPWVFGMMVFICQETDFGQIQRTLLGNMLFSLMLL